MRVAIRTDASREIGTGHLMRCLTLADALVREHKADVLFLCAPVTEPWRALIESHGHRFVVLTLADIAEWAEDQTPTHARWAPWGMALDATAVLAALGDAVEWLIVDHYALDGRWESLIRAKAHRLFVIDDLADRVHDCDVLLDQNIYENHRGRYGGLVPPDCRVLIGPTYALLRPEFAQEWNARQSIRNGTVKRILVFFGGSDPTGETVKTLRALRRVDLSGVVIDVVAGGQNPQLSEIRNLAGQMLDTTVAVDVDDMALRISAADLAIGACGTAALERCCLGLSSITLTTAANQRFLAAGLAAHHAIISLGDSARIDEIMLARAVTEALADPARLMDIEIAARSLFPEGPIGAQRCVEIMVADV